MFKNFFFNTIMLYLIFFDSDIAMSNQVSLVSCHGRNKGVPGVLYFHGLDSKKISSHEAFNRKQLIFLSKGKKINVAILRSHYTCKKNKLCWPKKHPSEVQKVLFQAIEAGRSCLSKSDKIIGLGFSNGGYFLSKVVQWCIKNSFDKFIVTGSAGSFNNVEKQNLSTCGKLEIFIGKKDMIYLKTQKYFQELKKRKAVVVINEFNGGHELPNLNNIFH